MRHLSHLLLYALAVSSAQAAVTYRKVALTGDTAEGSGGSFLSFTTFSMNGNGEVALYGVVSSIAGNTAGAVDGVWSEETGALKRVIQYGQGAPSVAATFNTFLATPVIRDNGSVIFRGTLSGGQAGVWTGTPTTGPSYLAMTGMGVPGFAPDATLASITYSTSDIPVFSPLGRLAFLGKISGTGITAGVNDEMIFTTGAGGPLTAVARKGDQPPGVPAGAKYNVLSKPDSYSPTGQVSFKADMSTGLGGVVSATKSGVWGGIPGALELRARMGDAIDFDYTYAAPDTKQFLNSAGTMVISTTVEDFFSAKPALVRTTGTPAVLVSQGMTVDDVPLASFGNDPTASGQARFYRFAMASSGIVAFEAPMAGTGVDNSNTWGLFTNTGGVSHLLLRQGQQVPGLPAGVVVRNTATDPSLNFSPFVEFHVNKFGHLFAQVFLAGTGVTTSNNRALLAMDHTGVWKVVARTGASFTLPGTATVKTISSLGGVSVQSSGSQDGKVMGWNDDGQAVIRLDFSDASSGIFVATSYEGPAGDDWDEDGMPNTWETANELDPNSDTGVNGAGGDYDLDGFSNWGEYVAGTLANDDQSYLDLTNFQPTLDGRMTFDFPALASRTYQVWYKENMNASTWLADGIPFPGINGTYTYYIFTPLTGGVYRVEARLP